MAAKKASKKKPASKRVTKVKTKATKMAAKKVAGKMPTVKEPMSKSGMIAAITDITCLTRKDVVAVFDCLTEVIEKHVKSGGPGMFVMPGLMKIKVIKKPARKARKGVNPFTGEEIMIKAKPAYKAVKIKALKKLKEMVA
ncbi:MAG: integration host factor [Gammaproteobacteria bacterium RIFCSPHIGHO2_12_FULL_43_28]|nr:MAG: integration host factor [Gammaproteobacteria bacterium RIFCSPHIGHO2_12_FULL_43_28]